MLFNICLLAFVVLGPNEYRYDCSECYTGTVSYIKIIFTFITMHKICFLIYVVLGLDEKKKINYKI